MTMNGRHDQLTTRRFNMHPAYFDTRFLVADSAEAWPQAFAIISAYATTGEEWPLAKNQAADQELELELQRRSPWLRRLTGYSPNSGHAEPSWAAAIPLAEACDIGLRFLQDAVYYVADGRLSVSYCDDRRGLVPVDDFRSRLQVTTA